VRLDVSATILRGPQNRTAFSHSTVNFSCISDKASDINWKYIEADSSSVNIFDKRGRNKKRFDERFLKTTNNSANFLTIHNVRASDAGIYSCYMYEDGSDNSRFAGLTVIG